MRGTWTGSRAGPGRPPDPSGTAAGVAAGAGRLRRLPATAGALALSLLVLAAPARGQERRAGAALDSVKAALDSGRVEAARTALQRWTRTRAPEASPRQRARARLLRARLAEDADVARREYARVALEGGPEGARARLRLAQLRLARGQHGRALEELDVLRADYPGRPPAAEAWLWTGRVREATGEEEAACRAYRRAEETALAVSAPSVGEAAGEALAGCGAGDGGRPGDAGPGGDGDAAAFAVQLGAFSTRQAALELRDRLGEAGFEARVLSPAGGGGLHRVRVGAADDREGAEALAGRLERRGFDAIVVSSGSTEDGP